MKKKLANLLLALVACLFAAFGFIACGENPLAVSAPKNVRINASTMAVEWDQVEGAAKYTISINDGTEYSISSTSYACSQFVMQQQTFTVKVCAVSSVGDMTSEATVMTFSPLPKITDLALSEDGSLTWSVVASATGYALRIDGVEQQAPLATTDYPITESGRHSYQVRPVVAGNESYYSIWSDVQQVTKLGTVDASKIKYDVEKGQISWSSVSGATAYDVYVNGFLEVEDCKATVADFDSPNANFVVEIKAKSTAQNTLAGETSEQKEFIFLDPVTNVRVENGVLVWDEVNLATGYIVKVGSKKETVTTTEYTKLTRGTSLNVSIMPVSEDAVYFSNWSAEKSFYLLEAPVIQWNSSLMLDDGSAKNNIYWDGIANAHGYELRITSPNGDETIETAEATDRLFAYDFLEVGTYTVELKATADPADSTFCDSPYSKEIKVTRLASPTQVSSNFITSIAQELSKGFTVSFEKVAKATGYRLYKEETEVATTTSDTSQFKVTNVAEAGVTSEKIYNYSIQSIGTDAMQNNTVILSSLKTKSLPFAITVLATPQGPNLDDQARPTIEGFLYKYGKVEKASGYAVDTGAKVYDANDTQFDLGVVLPAGATTVRVCAKGNGADVLASNYSEPISVHRLAEPYNITVVENGSGGKLDCAEVMGAKSYNAYLDSNKQILTSDQKGNISSVITEKGTGIYMEAVANEVGPDGTYYMTSRSSETFTLVKLAAPTFGNSPFSNTELVWNKPSNINEQIYSPKYTVYDGNTAYDEQLTGTSMNISNFDGGKSYTFTVKAVGGVGMDGKTVYITSEKSTPVSIYKIASPEVEIVNNQYQWTDVPRASSYAIFVDGVMKQTYELSNTGVYTYKPTFDEKKEYKVEVRAIGDGTNTLNSKQTTGKNYIIQQTAVLTAPDFSLAYSHTSVDDQGEIIVTITKESPNATGYYYTIDGTGDDSTTTTFSKKVSEAGVCKVSVYALGGAFDDQGVYYLKSPEQGGGNESKYTITLLDYLTSNEMEYYKSGSFEFEPIDNANYGYTVQICVNGGEWQTISTNKDTTIDVRSYVAGATSVQFKVQANGNGSNVIAGKVSESEIYEN